MIHLEQKINYQEKMYHMTKSLCTEAYRFEFPDKFTVLVRYFTIKHDKQIKKKVVKQRTVHNCIARLDDD